MEKREPSAIDQLMLELINVARANPQQEADRLLNGQLNEGVSPNSLITLTPKQPLAFNYYLIDSAYNHSSWMLANDIFSHTGIDNTTSQQRMARAGYEFIAPWGSGENIAWKGTTGDLDFNEFVIDNYTNLFVDENYPNRGHRVSLMRDEFQEVGIASLEGIFSLNGRDYNAVMTTQNFAYSKKDGAFLTGVIYTEEVIDDNFYSLGEGIANVRILAENIDTGDRIETVNFSTGGYSLFLPSGTYDISFIGNLDQDLADDIVKSKVTISDVNIKLDLATDDPNLATGILTSPTENNETENPIEENNIGNEGETNQTTDDLSILMDIPIYRLQNLDRPGTYLYAGEEEVRNIGRNYPQFQLEGLAFNVSETADEDLLTIYRFRNQNIAGTYLFVGEQEKNNILDNYPNFILEGTAFHVIPPSSNQGNSIYRFQNSELLGTYLFVGETEKNAILQDYPNFILEGTAFNVI
ncbi:CAP domain-containing protein [Cyanobacterium sp. Dongsha4]|uniref:CAP domain-containing protein n=1 Tax=Cyanobacterium sp. DS4 TaxID=2878255 RepID=UPI002E8190D5|nr:CAP domain-containing protein [Cyanobacterium sp. Dongsha4]WVL00376.1 CAP domain-containing protein [Cyanobacterium sp. Dongsha4]